MFSAIRPYITKHRCHARYGRDAPHRYAIRMTSSLARQWERGELPIRDMVYLADGRAFAVELGEHFPGGMAVTEPTSLDAILASDPDWLTSFVVTHIVELRSEEGGSVCCGEGSWGSEGFFARIASGGEPIWVVYLENSNPFVEIDIDSDDRVARFSSSSGVTTSVAISGTDFVPTPWPADSSSA